MICITVLYYFCRQVSSQVKSSQVKSSQVEVEVEVEVYTK
jgi:hypothetical protein